MKIVQSSTQNARSCGYFMLVQLIPGQRPKNKNKKTTEKHLDSARKSQPKIPFSIPHIIDTIVASQCIETTTKLAAFIFRFGTFGACVWWKYDFGLIGAQRAVALNHAQKAISLGQKTKTDENKNAFETENATQKTDAQNRIHDPSIT